MKTMIIALSAAALVAAAPIVVAQGALSQTPSAQHKISKHRHPGLSGHAVRRETGYPTALGYAPAEFSGSHRDMTDISPYAGGGGGGAAGGGGGGM